MAINITSRKETLTGNASSNQVFTVPFECENASDVTVYDPSGNKMQLDTDYSVTNNTMPGVSSNTITVTWIGTSPDGTVTFYRNSERTQSVSLTAGFKGNEIETAFDRQALAAQNTIRANNLTFGAGSSKITSLGEPIDAQDASTVRYAQEAYSQSGNICPPVSTVDNDKALYAQSTTSFIWKDPFDVPYPGATDKVLRVNGLGVPAWVDPPEYAPVYPVDEPKYLSVASEDESWRTVKQLPSLVKGNVGDTLVYQFDDLVAWRPIRWLPDLPNSKRFLYNSTGSSTDGTISGSTTDVSIAASKATTIYEDNKDYNQGGSWDCWIKGDLDAHRIPLLEFDCSGQVADNWTLDTTISCYLKIYFTIAGSSASRTFVVKRVKNTFVQGTGEPSNSYNDDGATWNKPTAPEGSPDWNWGDSVFEPDLELDHELPVSTLLIGSDTTTSAFTYIDITHLFLDAMKNRGGILRIAIYDPSDNASSRYARFYANGGHANDVKVELSRAVARKAYWQPWCYRNHHVTQVADAAQMVHPGWSNPHVWFKSVTNNFGIGADTPVTGGHVAAGKLVACAYSLAHDTGATYYARSEMLTTFIGSGGSTSIGCWIDMTNGWGEVATGITSRVASIWLADEPNE